MKILFYDGDIRQWDRPTNISYNYILDAAHRPSNNIERLELVRLNYYDCVIFTNSLVALDHRYGWNEKENHTDIYFYVESKHDFVRCDELAGREIREGHSVMKMFLNGAFDLE